MKKLSVVWVFLLLLAGCNTTNALIRVSPDYTDLPADDLRQLAGSIESIVAAGEEAYDLEPPPGIAVEIPEIRQAIRTRAIRSELVSELLDTGFALEERNGLIAVIRNSAYKKATNSRQRDRDALVVMSENDNRWSLYEGLLKANNWPPRSLSAVQEIFFEARVPLLKPGQRHEELPES